MLRKPEICNKTGLGATTIYYLEKKGDFPQHFMLTPRTAVWNEDEVDQWLAERQAANIKPVNSPDVAKRKTVGGRAASAEVKAARAMAGL
jgi:prophage regulatory protein